MIDRNKFGVSFSVKQCQAFQVSSKDCLAWLINEVGFRRFRLMSYWNEIEKVRGIFKFSELDRQINDIESAGGEVSLCLGVRQPRWPESHWPKWALKLPKVERYKSLEIFIEQVVQRYRRQSSIISYQLENEALNRKFGKNGDFNRRRLINEFELVKRLDPGRPIIMTTSNSYGLPLKKPVPDIVGFSIYRTQFHKGKYRSSRFPVWSYRMRAALINRPCFIHELQAEPWGSNAIWEMSIAEQNKSMPSEKIAINLDFAKKVGLFPIDLWGGEWWYWRWRKFDDNSLKESIRQNLSSQSFG